MFAFALLIPAVDPVMGSGRIVPVLPDPDVPETKQTAPSSPLPDHNVPETDSAVIATSYNAEGLFC